MSDNIEVRLVPSEMMIAAQIGVMRRVNHIARSLDDVIEENNGGGPWETDVVAAQAELAVAKHFNLYWSGARLGKPGEPKPIDVGECIEVRSVTQDWHRLIVRPPDNDQRPFVCVFVKDDLFTLLGWMLASDAKVERFKGLLKKPTDKPYWAVEPKHLHPITRLQTWVEQGRSVKS